MVDMLVLGMVFLLLWGGHWMRWGVAPFLVNEEGRLHRPLAYGYGCGCILAGFVLWAYVRAQEMPLVSVWDAAAFLWWDMVAAGAGTMAPRVVRWIEEARNMREDLGDYEQAIKERGKET